MTYHVAEKTRSELYLSLVPAVNSGRVRLLASDRLTDQIVALERRTSRAGHDIVDHPPGGHDDLANAAAGALVLAATGTRSGASVGAIDTDVRIHMHRRTVRAWHRGPGISAVDGQPVEYPRPSPPHLHKI